MAERQGGTRLECMDCQSSSCARCPLRDPKSRAARRAYWAAVEARVRRLWRYVNAEEQ